MQVHLTIRGLLDEEHDVEVMATTDVSAAELVAHLGADIPTTAVLRCATGPLPPQALVGGPGLRSGSVISLVDVGEKTSARTSVLELRVLSGPDSGRVTALNRGTHIVGRAPDTDVPVNDLDLSRHHFELVVGSFGITIRDLGSTNGTTVSGRLLTTTAEISSSELIGAGRSVLCLEAINEPPAAIKAGPDGSVLVNRPPRFDHRLDESVIEFPRPSPALERPRTQWAATLVPATLGLGMAAVMRNVMFLAFSLLGPVSLLVTGFTDRRSWRRSRRSAVLELELATQTAQSHLHERLALEVCLRRREHPDACAVARAAATPDCRVWERRPGDVDFLRVRIGSADRPAYVGVVGWPEHVCLPTVPFVPVVVSLALGHLGLAGPPAFVNGLSRWILGQIFALHSPDDVVVIALLDGAGQHQDSDGWRWLRWTNARIATTAPERADLLLQLAALVNDRVSRVQHEPWDGPHTVVLLDPIAVCAGSAGLRAILQEGPSVGITALCVASDQRLLPHECRAVVGFDSADGSRVTSSAVGQTALKDVDVERVSYEWAEQLARDLAPLRDANAGGSASIPIAVRLSDAVGLPEISPSQLLKRWARCDRPATALGAGADGPLVVDLLRDGPHGLIAGTTGAGKSELLRSLVAGLATTNPPDKLAFVLIDYKGGAAFAECAQLPHTVAVITDLDPHLTRRALMSLDAELRRREVALSAAGVSDLQDFVNQGHCDRTPMPRLVLIVDEFAALAEELPDFISGLVGIAQRGRSLGVHLFLATQRPGGVVSPEIKANMALRIALRVTDSAESADVIGSGAAAAIAKSMPGRGYIKLADGLVEFQAAQVGLPARIASDLEVTILDKWNRRIKDDIAEQAPKIDLQLIVDAAREAATVLGAPTPPPVWLEPLPSVLLASSLETGSSSPFVIAYALTDTPAAQCQAPLLHDLAAGGSLALIGGPKSGRTTALRTIAGVAGKQLGVHDLQLYVIDCAGVALSGLGALAGCATALTAEEPAAVCRLVDRLSSELNRRQAELAAEGLTDFADARAHNLGLPAILLLIDGWEGFSALTESIDGGRTSDTLLRLLRDGPSVGFTVIIAGDRALLGIRISSVTKRKLLLSLTDRSDYAAAGIDPRQIAKNIPAGRAFLNEDATELQVAVLDLDCSSIAQWNAIKSIPEIANAGEGAPEYAPIRIRALPQRINFSDMQKPCDGVSLGLGGDDAAAITARLTEPECRFLICGPARSGRSWAARLIAIQAHALGVNLLIAAHAKSPLAQWALAHRVPTVDPHAKSGMPGSFDGLILVDDAELFNDTYVGDRIQEFLTHDRVGVIASARSEELMVSFRGIAVTLRRHRSGILLAPTAADGELLGISVPRALGLRVPGRGLLVTDDVRIAYPNGLPIQIAATG